MAYDRDTPSPDGSPDARPVTYADIPNYTACGYFAPLAALHRGNVSPPRVRSPTREQLVFRSLTGESLRIPAECTNLREARLSLTEEMGTFLPFLVLLAMPSGRELPSGDDELTLAHLAAQPDTFVSVIVRVPAEPWTEEQWLLVLNAHLHHATGMERALTQIQRIGGVTARQEILREALLQGVNNVQTPASDIAALLRARADPNCTDTRGAAPPSLNSTMEIFLRAVNTMPDDDRVRGARPLLYVAWNGRVDVAEALLDGGAEVNGSDAYGATALHAAVEQGHRHCVAFLVQRRADVNVANQLRVTPLQLAVTGGLPDIVEMLVRFGAR